jgi:DNA-binding CsgD family transcriptional regulator
MSSRAREAIDLLSKGGQAAFAIDNTDRIVFWNKQCEQVLGYPAQQVLGRHCYEVMGGRDANGNVYCYRNCPVAAQARTEDDDDAVRPFVLFVKDSAGKTKRIVASLYAIPAVRAELSTVIHVLQEEDGAQPTALEQQVAEVASTSPAPRWPLMAKTGPADTELTSREKEILRCLAEGLPTPVIARKLYISPVTVRNHIQNILQKLEVHTKLAAVVFAYRHNLI